MSAFDITSGPDARFGNTTNWHRRYHDSWSRCQCAKAADHQDGLAGARGISAPTAGQVERAARAIYDVDRDTYCSPPWEAAEELVQADYRRLAAAALSSLAGEEQR